MMNMDALKKELDTAVGEAVSFADLGAKYAALAEKFGPMLGVAGVPEVEMVANAVVGADKALHVLQTALGAV